MLKRLLERVLRRSAPLEAGAGAASESARAIAEAVAGADQLQLCLNRAAQRAADGDHASAASLYREILELQPREPWIWCNFGAALDAIGQSDKAERAYRKALELEPGLAQAWYNLGRLLQLGGRAAESWNCYREAAARVDLGADRALWQLIYSNWGLLLYNQGRAQDAVALHRKALAEHPQATDLMSCLLLALQYTGGHTQAESFAEHLAYAQRFETPLRGTWPSRTLEGSSFVSRMGVSMLANLGLTQLIAGTPQDYVAIATRLARDPERLALRAGLRERMANSRLTDAKQFTHNLEKAYREMWVNWCVGFRVEGR